MHKSTNWEELISSGSHLKYDQCFMVTKSVEIESRFVTIYVIERYVADEFE